MVKLFRNIKNESTIINLLLTFMVLFFLVFLLSLWGQKSSKPSLLIPHSRECDDKGRRRELSFLESQRKIILTPVSFAMALSRMVVLTKRVLRISVVQRHSRKL